MTSKTQQSTSLKWGSTLIGSSHCHWKRSVRAEPHTSFTSFWYVVALVFFSRSICVWLDWIALTWSPNMHSVKSPNKILSTTKKITRSWWEAPEWQRYPPLMQEMYFISTRTMEYMQVTNTQKTNSKKSLWFPTPTQLFTHLRLKQDRGHDVKSKCSWGITQQALNHVSCRKALTQKKKATPTDVLQAINNLRTVVVHLHNAAPTNAAVVGTRRLECLHNDELRHNEC